MLCININSTNFSIFFVFVAISVSDVIVGTYYDNDLTLLAIIIYNSTEGGVKDKNIEISYSF